jgi:hypothetical protein
MNAQERCVTGSENITNPIPATVEFGIEWPHVIILNCQHHEYVVTPGNQYCVGAPDATMAHAGP